MQKSFTPSQTVNIRRLSFWYPKRMEPRYKRYMMMLMRMQGFAKKKLGVFMIE